MTIFEYVNEYINNELNNLLIYYYILFKHYNLIKYKNYIMRVAVIIVFITN